MSDEFFAPWPEALPSMGRERISIPGVNVVKCHSRKWAVAGRGKIAGYVRRSEFNGNFGWRVSRADGQEPDGLRCPCPYATRKEATLAFVDFLDSIGWDADKEVDKQLAASQKIMGMWRKQQRGKNAVPGAKSGR